MAEMAQWDALWLNVNIATMVDGYGTIEQGALAVAGGRIAWLGKAAALPAWDKDKVICYDGQGGWLTPGLIDCHNHLIYGGSRAAEFELRLNGASYEEIARQGGGILSTVRATRAASDKQLLTQARARALTLMSQGVTTLEVKTGYGLSFEQELRLLRLIAELDHSLPLQLQPTCLAAHALPPEYADDADGYIAMICERLLPEVASQKLATAVDVFCESVGFNLRHTEAVLARARELGLAVKIHAEQLSNMGATRLACRYQALSADHLEYLDEAGVAALAEAGAVAVLLPGAFYFLRERQLPPLALLRRYRVPVAIATDLNPGSSPLCSLPLMMNMACTLFSLTPLEAWQGVSYHAARALGLENEIGQLKVGMQADLALWAIDRPAELCYQFGTNPLRQLIKAGQPVTLPMPGPWPMPEEKA